MASPSCYVSKRLFPFRSNNHGQGLRLIAPSPQRERRGKVGDVTPARLVPNDLCPNLSFYSSKSQREGNRAVRMVMGLVSFFDFWKHSLIPALQSARQDGTKTPQYLKTCDSSNYIEQNILFSQMSSLWLLPFPRLD